MTRRILVLIPAVLGLAVQLACDKLSDPAVRLAYCMEEGVKKADTAATSIQVNCDLKIPGDFVVVLHPSGDLKDEEFASAGAPPAVIADVRALRIGDHPSIYVIATGKQTPNSRTTYQNNFVKIDKLMVVFKSSRPVTVDISGSAGARTIQSIR